MQHRSSHKMSHQPAPLSRILDSNPSILPFVKERKSSRYIKPLNTGLGD
jgi:hypothetical protein